MKKLIIIFMVFLSLWADTSINDENNKKTIVNDKLIEYKLSDNLWDSFNKLIDNYKKLLYKDLDENIQDKLLSENEKIYDNIVRILNNKDIPLSIDVDFFNRKKALKEYAYLKRKIEINQNSGNIEAVHRDKFRIEYLKLKEHIVDFILYYRSNIDNMNFKSIIKDRIKEESDYLQLSDITKYKSFVDKYKDKKDSSKVISRMIENFKEYTVLYFMYKDFLSYVDNSIQTELTEKIVEELYFVKLADYINHNNYINFDRVNIKLEKYDLNVGKIVVSLLLLIIFIIIGMLLNKTVVNRTDRYISEKYENNEELKDILHTSFLKIKRAILFVMAVTSLHISITLLYFGNDINIYVKKSILVLHIIAIYWFLLTLIDVIALIIFNSKKYVNRLFIRKELANLTVFSLKIVISVVALLIILHTTGLNITGILTGLGISGIVVAYGLRNSLNNFFGTISSIMNDIYSLGDWIEFDGKEGTVAEINFSTTKVRTFDNALITVPNSHIVSIPVTNWSRRKYGRRIKFVINITYNSKREDVQNAIEEINRMLEEHPEIATPRKNIESLPKDRKSKLMNTHDVYGIKNNMFVKLIGFNESSIDILIYTFSKTVDWGKWLDIRQDVLFKIWKILEDNNLEFAFPTRTVILENNKNT